jgi:hypothetical protein
MDTYSDKLICYEYYRLNIGTAPCSFILTGKIETFRVLVIPVRIKFLTIPIQSPDFVIQLGKIAVSL